MRLYQNDAGQYAMTACRWMLMIPLWRGGRDVIDMYSSIDLQERGSAAPV